MNEFTSDDPRDASHLPSTEGDDEAWVSEEDIKDLTAEAEIFGTDLVQQAEKILEENLPAITLSVVKLARHAQSETVRLNAAKYVIDRNLGRISDPEPDGADILKEFFGDVVTEVR